MNNFLLLVSFQAKQGSLPVSSIKLKQYVYHLVKVDFSHIISEKYLDIFSQKMTTVVSCYPLLAAICDF